MLQIPQQNMFSVQFPHSQAIVFFSIHTVSFFSNAQGGNEMKKKGSREKQPETDFLFFFSKEVNEQLRFFYSTQRKREKRRGRERQQEVNDVKEFIYILILYERSTMSKTGKKLFFKHIRNSRHTLLYLLQSKLTENLFYYFLFLLLACCLFHFE